MGDRAMAEEKDHLKRPVTGQMEREKHPTLKEYLKLLRVKHWIKNVFVLASLLFSLNFYRTEYLLRILLMFLSFSLGSSVVYVINDIAGREKDRFHPVKRHRPIASGRISVESAAVLSTVLFVVSLAGAWLLDLRSMLVVATYIGINIIYSYILRNQPCIDVMVIAVGFLLRVIAGAMAIDVKVSEWMLLTTFFLSLFLGFGKRRKEMIATLGSTRHRTVFQHYSLELLNYLIVVSASLTIITYSLYVVISRNMIRLGSERFVFTIPFVVFGVFRYLLLIYHNNDGGDPADILLRDRAMQVDIFL
jgi:4-hydroxybenzoate polyprenyltransferase